MITQQFQLFKTEESRDIRIRDRDIYITNYQGDDIGKLFR